MKRTEHFLLVRGYYLGLYSWSVLAVKPKACLVIEVGPGEGNKKRLSNNNCWRTGRSVDGEPPGIDGVWTVIFGVWTDGCGLAIALLGLGSGKRTKSGISRFRGRLFFGGVKVMVGTSTTKKNQFYNK